MTIKERYLKAKHWQLFLLTFGIPVIFQIFLMIKFFTDRGEGSETETLLMFRYMKFFPVIMIIYVAVYFGWFWAVATGLQYKVPENVKMKTRKFKLFFFIPLIYILLISIVIGIAMSNLPLLIDEEDQPSDNQMMGLGFIVLLLHLFSIFCILYTFYFVAKTLKTVELQRETTFSDFAGEFFLIWFYPIGIWFLQPKVNRMAGDEEAA